MKKTFLAALCAALAACGGDDSSDPASAKFDYGAATPVTVGTDAAYAADAGEAAFSEALLVRGETDPALAQDRAGSVMSLPDAMANEVLDGFGGGMLMSSSGAEPLATMNALTGRFGTPIGDAISARLGGAVPAVLDACVTVQPGVIRYSNCTETETFTDDTGTYTATITMNGTFSFTLSGGNTALDWDVDMVLEQTGSGMNLDVKNGYTGSLDIGPATIVGGARSDLDARVSMTGYPSVDFALTHLVDYDLDYQAEPFCVTGGTLELRRVWRDRPTGATSGDLPDEGVLFTFTGCGAAQVAWGTR